MRDNIDRSQIELQNKKVLEILTSRDKTIAELEGKLQAAEANAEKFKKAAAHWKQQTTKAKEEGAAAMAAAREEAAAAAKEEERHHDRPAAASSPRPSSPRPAAGFGSGRCGFVQSRHPEIH